MMDVPRKHTQRWHPQIGSEATTSTTGRNPQ